MSGFLYFIANRNAPLSDADLEALGLAYTSNDGRPGYNARWDVGPSGEPGWCLAYQDRLGDWQPVYRPDEQRWRRVPGSDGVWIGFYTAAPPTSDTLARGTMIDGNELLLGDGGVWQVPLVRHVVGVPPESQYALPRYVDIDDLGKPILGDVVDEHRELVAIVDPFWDSWVDAWRKACDDDSPTFRFDVPNVYDRAARVLGKNYAVSLIECVVLKLFRSDRGAADVLKEACDCDFASVLLQKKTRCTTDAA